MAIRVHQKSIYLWGSSAWPLVACWLVIYLPSHFQNDICKKKENSHTPKKKSQRLIRYAYFAETCDLTDLLYMPRNKILSILIKEMSFNSRCMYMQYHTYTKYHRSVSHSTPQLQTIIYRREKNLLKILCFCILYEKLQKNFADFEAFLWSFSSSRNCFKCSNFLNIV